MQSSAATPHTPRPAFIKPFHRLTAIEKSQLNAPSARPLVLATSQGVEQARASKDMLLAFCRTIRNARPLAPAPQMPTEDMLRLRSFDFLTPAALRTLIHWMEHTCNVSTPVPFDLSSSTTSATDFANVVSAAAALGMDLWAAGITTEVQARLQSANDRDLLEIWLAAGAKTRGYLNEAIIALFSAKLTSYTMAQKLDVWRMAGPRDMNVSVAKRTMRQALKDDIETQSINHVQLDRVLHVCGLEPFVMQCIRTGAAIWKAHFGDSAWSECQKTTWTPELKDLTCAAMSGHRPPAALVAAFRDD